MKKELKVFGLLLIKNLIVFGVIFSIVAWYLGAFNINPSRYTEEEHLQRVAERIQKKYIDGKDTIASTKITDFEVFPVYDQYDNFKYILVECQPTGYLFVYIVPQNQRFGTESIYKQSKAVWSPYTIDYENNSEKLWEVDENGKIKKYYSSPYKVRDIKNEKLYLIREKSLGSIPAVKRGDKFLNLVSNIEFEIIDGHIQNEQPIANIVFYLHSKSDDL